MSGKEKLSVTVSELPLSAVWASLPGNDQIHVWGNFLYFETESVKITGFIRCPIVKFNIKMVVFEDTELSRWQRLFPVIGLDRFRRAALAVRYRQQIIIFVRKTLLVNREIKMRSILSSQGRTCVFWWRWCLRRVMEFRYSLSELLPL